MSTNWRKLVLCPWALRRSVASRRAPYVPPQPTRVISASSGPYQVGRRISFAASSCFRMRLFICSMRSSDSSVLWPMAVCSSPVVMYTAFGWPGIAPGDGDLAEVDRIHLDGPDGVREVQVAQDDDRRLVHLGQVEGAMPGLEAL